MNKYKKYYLCCIPLLISLSAKHAVAGTFSASASERIEYSTNVGRSSNEVDDTIFNTTLNLGYDNESEKYPTSFNVQATHQEYLDDSFGDQVNYLATFNSNLRSAKGRFQWNIVDIYRTVDIDTIQPDTPDNSEDTNYFSTGPDWYIIRNSRTSLLWSYRYEDLYFQSTDADRRDDLTSLRLTRNISRRTQAGLSTSFRKSDPKNLATTDITRFDYNLFLRRTGRASIFNLQVGESNYTSETRQGEVVSKTEQDAVSYRVEFTNRITANSNFSLTFSRSLADATDRLLLDLENIGEVELTNESANNQSDGVFVQKRFSASYDTRKSWGDLNLTAIYSDEDYTDDTLDTTLFTTVLNLNFPVSNRTSYGLQYSFSKQERLGGTPVRNFEENLISGSITRRIESSLRLSFSLTYRDRDDNTPGLSYTETRAIFDIAYTF